MNHIKKETIKKIELEAKKFFKKASGCHDWTHIERVRNLALKIGKKEKANLNVLEISALLHDIGRSEEMKKKGKFCHAEKGAELAKIILEKYKITEIDKKNILHCIISHRYRNAYVPETIEAKVLFDADKLDSIGAVGIGRNFLFAGNCGSKILYSGREKKIVKSGKAREYAYTKDDSAILEYEFKLKYVKNKMTTKTGKKIAKKRHDFMVKFHERFEKEISGEL